NVSSTCFFSTTFIHHFLPALYSKLLLPNCLTHIGREGETMVNLIRGSVVSTLDLDDTRFEQYCLDLIRPLEVSGMYGAGYEAHSLVEFLMEESRSSNLGLLSRARLLRLRGMFALHAAGTDSVRLHDAAKQLKAAYHIADFCTRASESEASDAKASSQKESLVLTMQGVVMAGLVRCRSWHCLVGVSAPRWPADGDWEGLVEADGGLLLEECGVAVGRESDSGRGSALSDEIRALGLRAIALYTVTRDDHGKQGRHWAEMLLTQAAALNRGRVESCRALNLLDAALITNNRHSRKNYLEEAHHILRGLPPGRVLEEVLYLKLLRIVFAERPKHPLRKLERLADEFDLAGSPYFSQLAKELSRSRRS
ncbi:MAG: hypothetical protein ACHQ9S_16685, partial [Candidatus Binatia bacterium]